MVLCLSIFGFLIIFITMAAIGALAEIRDVLKDIRDELKEHNRR